MNKKQLVAAMAEKTGMKLLSRKALNAFIESVNGALKSGESIQLPDLVFQVRERGEREGVIPRQAQRLPYPLRKW